MYDYSGLKRYKIQNVDHQMTIMSIKFERLFLAGSMILCGFITSILSDYMFFIGITGAIIYLAGSCVAYKRESLGIPITFDPKIINLARKFEFIFSHIAPIEKAHPSYRS